MPARRAKTSGALDLLLDIAAGTHEATELRIRHATCSDGTSLLLVYGMQLVVLARTLSLVDNRTAALRLHGERGAARLFHDGSETQLVRGTRTDLLELVAEHVGTTSNDLRSAAGAIPETRIVHPTLAARLAEWKLVGWSKMMGRQPGPDDLIVPLPPEAAARRRTRTGEPFRSHDYSGKRWREQDLPALGWRHRQHYDMKATFITLLGDDGAKREIIRDRVTHTKPRTVFDGYDRGAHWAETCAEVAKLKLTRTIMHGMVITLPVAKCAESAGGTGELATAFATGLASSETSTKS